MYLRRWESQQRTGMTHKGENKPGPPDITGGKEAFERFGKGGSVQQKQQVVKQ